MLDYGLLVLVDLSCDIYIYFGIVVCCVVMIVVVVLCQEILSFLIMRFGTIIICCHFWFSNPIGCDMSS